MGSFALEPDPAYRNMHRILDADVEEVSQHEPAASIVRKDMNNLTGKCPALDGQLEGWPTSCATSIKGLSGTDTNRPVIGLHAETVSCTGDHEDGKR